MIITFPTGSYRSILPKKPDDSGNITFTISNNLPPRVNLVFLQVPPSIRQRTRPQLILTEEERRAAVSQLAFSVLRSTNDQTASGKKQFESGQILEFEEVEEIIAEPMLVGPVNEIRHDTNLFDLSVFNVSDTEEKIIAEQANTVFQILTEQLNEIKMLRSNTELQIADNQKSFNELNKTLNSLIVVQSNITSTDIASIIDKLQVTKVQLEQERQDLISKANNLANEAETLNKELLQVSVLVR